MKAYSPEENKYLINNWHVPIKTLGRFLKRSPEGVRCQIRKLKKQGRIEINKSSKKQKIEYEWVINEIRQISRY